MKKGIAFLLTMLALPAVSATQTECAYTPLQTLIRNVRDVREIDALMQQGVIFDDTQIRCGGSLMQLAIVRGNPDVLRALLQQDIKRVAQKVGTESFMIPNAPKQIPLLLFAAYYAPNAGMMDLMIQAADAVGMGINQTDDKGQNILWYLDKNPVLRNSPTTDMVTQKMLSSLVPTKNTSLGAEGTQPVLTTGTIPPQKEIQIQSALANRMTGKEIPGVNAGDKIVEPISQVK